MPKSPLTFNLAHYTLFSVALLLCTVLGSIEVNAGMFGFFKQYNVHLSPEVKGRITINGTSIPDIEIERILDYDQEYIETTRTDQHGRFYFPAKNIKSSRPGKLLDESRIRQVIGLSYQGQRYLLWYTTTSSLVAEQVLVEKLNNLSCDLANPEKRHEFRIHENPSFYHVILSICRW
ncbi:DUF6795 domain-containing protein [Marinobacter caseinilyticus]|uniref:DUF6795 domain-containing protein n=1 Tax=Marinobacter caseinilyticus TaxID=2692195 RepID=UPI001F346053|nr:DUF6795 domain-containing protein [Marinobacter caseinilyticus]